MTPRPRPIHRWKSFWLGLFVAGFLAWAWVHSYRIGGAVSYSWADGTMMAMHGNGACYLVSGRLWGGTGFDGTYRRRFNPAELIAIYDSAGADVPHVRIPHAAVFFTYLGLWAGWLVWQRKREQRKPTAILP